MPSNTRLRWALLLGTLGLTLVAMYYPLEDDLASPALPSAARAPQTAPSTLVENLSAETVAETEQAEAGRDPFAPRGWSAPPPPAPPPAPAPLVVAPVDLTPAGPPELPFRYVGSLVDGSEQTVYLARGDQAYVLKPGDVVDATYKVLGITPTQIEFEHLPTSAKQALVFPAREN
ncbi:hypothetical protein GTP58_06410 [Duganella sp. CY15W]|uniref:hypothetical protein n=1 Tax=Duganella sp. CY15W TaxID=2692172 RepID=UPI001370850F|nr:hypothetical protein [Duganella sp. CY15W]MYM27950.1 hypothetical protein [Duganella sp. CY15W]